MFGVEHFFADRREEFLVQSMMSGVSSTYIIVSMASAVYTGEYTNSSMPNLSMKVTDTFSRKSTSWSCSNPSWAKWSRRILSCGREWCELRAALLFSLKAFWLLATNRWKIAARVKNGIANGILFRIPRRGEK
jgi:hypothetical protein